MVRDTRQIHISPAVSEAQEAIQAYVSARTVAVTIGDDNRLDIGSATCVQLGGRFFLATAAHNLVDGSEIRVFAPKAQARFPVIGRSHPPRNSTDPDVGWLELSPGIVQEGRLQFLSAAELHTDVPHRPLPLLVQGYPAAEANVVRKLPLRVELLSMGLGTDWLRTEPNGSLVLEYPPQSPEDTGLELPNPSGVSGGGVWLVSPFEPQQIWFAESFSLVGIVTAWSNSGKELFAAPIKPWLELIASDFPELSTALAEVRQGAG